MCAGVRCEPNFFGFTTLELMELENIVANTVYLKAREGMLCILTLDVSLICVLLECEHTNYYVIPHVLSEFWHFINFLPVACCCLLNYLFQSMFEHRLCIHVIFIACLTFIFLKVFFFLHWIPVGLCLRPLVFTYIMINNMSNISFFVFRPLIYPINILFTQIFLERL